MKKVIIIYSRFYDFSTEQYEIGGIETYIRNLCRIVQGMQFQAHVVFASSTMVKCRQVDGIYLHSIKGDMRMSPSALIKAASGIGDSKKDIFIFGTSSLVRKSTFKNVLAIQHGVYWDTDVFHGKTFHGRLMTTCLRAVQGLRQLYYHSLVSSMICVDLNYVNWMRSLSISNRLPYTYIPNFAPLLSERKHRAKSITRLVFARRFESIRGCSLLIEVLPKILKKYADVEAVIAGGGTMSSELHEVFDKYKAVSFTKYDAKRSVEFHSHFDIALVPSIASEGTSLSLLEAMSAGCAVVATDVGGMTNIILNRHNGMLIRPTADDLYRAICELIEDKKLRQRLQANAMTTVEDTFAQIRWDEQWSRIITTFD